MDVGKEVGIRGLMMDVGLGRMADDEVMRGIEVVGREVGGGVGEEVWRWEGEE